MTIIGIDPGKSGGISVIQGEHVQLYVMPLTADGNISGKRIAEIIGAFQPNYIFVEKVHAMPGQGVTSMFTFGEGYGRILGALEALGESYELIAPQTWKKVVLKDTAKDKTAAIAFCERSYPNVSLLATDKCKKAHDGKADALCIAHYGLIKYGGLI
jgi:crossover junction endodeoxyribonuclease RuvC